MEISVEIACGGSISVRIFGCLGGLKIHEASQCIVAGRDRFRQPFERGDGTLEKLFFGRLDNGYSENGSANCNIAQQEVQTEASTFAVRFIDRNA